MRISFTATEIEGILEALEDYFCLDCPDAIEKYNTIVKKFKNAMIRSRASKGKQHSIWLSEREKRRQEDDETRKTVLKLYKEREQ